MSDRIVESLNEMKQIYLESVSGQVVSERDEYLQYIEEKMKKMKKKDEEEEDNEDEEDEEDEDEEGEKDEEKPKRWWDDDGDGIGYEKGEVSGKFKKKKKSMKESFSSWRNELYEKVGDVEADIENSKQKKIEEKSGINNKIDINPNVNIGEQVELSEEYIEEVIDIAAQYFYEQGLNEKGLEMVIEELGYDKFVEYVFYISEDFILTEARKARKRKGGKSYEEIKAEIDAREAAKKKPTVAKKVAVSKGDETVNTAVNAQAPRPQQKSEPKGFDGAVGKFKAFVTSKDTKDKLTDMVGAAVRKAKSDIGKTGMAAIHATGAAKKARQRGASGAGAAGAAAGTFFRGLMRGSTATGVREEIESFLLEKSESQQQQKLFGLALSVKRGETPRSEASKAVLDIVDGMSENEIRKFAKTPHKGLPKKVED